MDENEELDLADFVEQENDILMRFALDWLYRRKQDPAAWPIRLTLSKWHEQLKLFHDADPTEDKGC